MKKAVICLAIICLAVFSATAQARFGVEGGVCASSLSKDAGVILDNTVGYYVGPTVEASFPVVGLGVEGSILFVQKGVKSEDQNAGGNLDEKVNFIEVPVSLTYKFLNLPGVSKIVSPFIYAGPYASFKVSEKWENFDDNVREQLKTKTFGAGINLGLGVELFNVLQIRGEYVIALANHYTFENITLKERACYIGLRLHF